MVALLPETGAAPASGAKSCEHPAARIGAGIGDEAQPLGEAIHGC